MTDVWCNHCLPRQETSLQHPVVTRIRPLALLLAAAWLSAAAGCGGGGLETVPVGGTVTLDGKALDHGFVRFVPVDTTKGRLATATIQKDGTFKLSTANSDGVLLGDYKVVVECMKITNDVPEKDRELGIGGKVSEIPVKYNDPEKSGLTEKITDGKTVTLELKSS